MLRVVPLILFLGTGCTDSLDPLQRDGVAEAAGNAVGTAPIYLALAGITPAPTTLVTGTRDSFVIDGTVSSPSSGTAQLAGAGGTTANTLDMHLSAKLVAWRDEFWKVTLDGTLDVVDTATFGDPAAPLPTKLLQHITGELEVSGKDRYAFDLEICYRGNGQVFGYNRSGMTGTVEGEPVVDQVAGFDSTCDPAP